MLPLLEEIALVVALPLEPAPALNFGTEADRTNFLRRATAAQQALHSLQDLLISPTEGEQSALEAPSQLVLVNTRPGGFCLSPLVLDALFERNLAFFGEGWAAADCQLPREELGALISNAVVKAGLVYFLKERAPEVRCDAWLVEQLQTLGSAAMVGKYCRELKLIEVPAGVSWYLNECEDGSESVHESHRSWH